MSRLAVTIDIASPEWDAVANAGRIVIDALHATCPAVIRIGPGSCREEGEASVAVLLTNDAGMAELNGRHRGKNKPTNVLSFPAPPGFPTPPGETPPLGDIALAFETIAREAIEQGKRIEDHIAHLAVHGLLHLLGHDHESSHEAETMEDLERCILAKLGVADPYAGPAP